MAKSEKVETCCTVPGCLEPRQASRSDTDPAFVTLCRVHRTRAFAKRLGERRRAQRSTPPSKTRAAAALNTALSPKRGPGRPKKAKPDVSVPADIEQWLAVARDAIAVVQRLGGIEKARALADLVAGGV